MTWPRSLDSLSSMRAPVTSTVSPMLPTFMVRSTRCLALTVTVTDGTAAFENPWISASIR